MGVDGQRHTPAAILRERDPLPIVQEAEWAPGPVWMSAGDLSHTGSRIVQSVASLCADRTVPAHPILVMRMLIFWAE
jgi:hypothetical protein